MELVKSNKDLAIGEVVKQLMKLLEDNLLTLEDISPLILPVSKINSKPPKSERRGCAIMGNGLKAGTVYQDPNSNQTWTAGGKGARPKWIQKLLMESTDMSSLVLIDSPQS